MAARRSKRKAPTANVHADIDQEVAIAASDDLIAADFGSGAEDSSEDSVYSGLEEEEESSNSSDVEADGVNEHVRVLFGNDGDDEMAGQDDSGGLQVAEPARRVVRRKRSPTTAATGAAQENGGEFDELLARPSPATGASASNFAAAASDSGVMVVDTSDSDTTDDEHSRNTLGKIPSHWYDDEEHAGYDLDGKKILKSQQEKDRLERFLAKMDDPNYGRTLIDPVTKQEVVLSTEDVEMIKRIQSGKFPSATMDPYEDYIDFFTHETRVTPLSAAPEPKRRFVPSKHEHKRVMKMVRAIRKGWLKLDGPDPEAPEVYDIWEQPHDFNEKVMARHIVAPKVALPGHAESYNPPPEYIPTEEEIKRWEDMEPEDRPYNFIPKKYSSLRLVPGYQRFVQERFSRCLDLYLCPRMIKQKMNVDPESLIPKLPRPQDLQPYPTKQSILFKGHSARVTCISVDPTGLWLASGSDDGTMRCWEINTGRCVKNITVGEAVASLAWNPNPVFHVLAVAVDQRLLLINPRLGSKRTSDGTDFILKPKTGTASILQWASTSKGEQFDTMGLRFTITHKRPVEQVTWHHKGNYIATVIPTGLTEAVFIHAMQRQTSQNPFSKTKAREVQRVIFHPVQPIFFVASKTHVRVYNLQTQTLVKKLVTGMQWVSSMAIHPKGDNVILGSYDRRLAWFDLDLSVRPYKTLRYHSLALRSVAFHPTYPLFASASDDTSIHIFHGMVYNDLMQNPLIVPVKNLRGYHSKDAEGLGVLDICFHPKQPWLFSAGADSTIRLFT